ncbi:MAG: dimethyl sulfoxide reductase anchor subunit [Pseudolabrys sp.]|jgi:DMSO reductase anchor subunit
MHPAVSVIFFTTATGAGYGLLALLGVGAALGLLPPHLALALTGLGLALTLISSGLLASTAHLGHPERAWRALSQWRSSWLSREGIAAIFTYVPTAAFAVGWIILGRVNGWVAAAGLLAALGAIVTVSMTGMIYASLKPVAQWHTPFTLPAYLIFAAMTGLTLFNAILQVFGLGPQWLIAVAALATLGGWGFKRAVWRHDSGMENRPTLNSATGLTGGRVRSVQWPHSERNYLLKEMGYRIARKHSARLRRIAQVLAFAVPLALFAVAVFATPWAAVTACVLTVPVQLAGMLIERWLFFAEATHTVTLYYGLP